MTRSACLWFFCFLTAWGVIQEFLVGFACTPVGDINPSHNAHCIETLVVWYLTSVMNIITDFIIFLIPIPAVKQLQLRRKQKIMVGGIFCIGFFTCIISIVRLCFLRAGINTHDPTWDNVPVAYWSVIELNSGIICASAATLRPLLRKIIPGLHSNSEAYRYNLDKTSLKTSTTGHDGAPDPYSIPELAISPSPKSEVSDPLQPARLSPLPLGARDSTFTASTEESQSGLRLPRQSHHGGHHAMANQERPGIAAVLSVDRELQNMEKAEVEEYEGDVDVKPKAAKVVGLR
jgi:hypothetical protein